MLVVQQHEVVRLRQDARVQVNFGNQGVKWLAVALAKLQVA